MPSMPAAAYSPLLPAAFGQAPFGLGMGLELERGLSPGPASSPSSPITLERNECYRESDNSSS